ncbi:prepilin-type N-terminal cleavage/methylation domain-containing protein [Saccharibacillus sp. JS10]|uniref:prepilin-type N-terminal cleavage/methylation domain-containing protein n=1 Tax=Saccharibacillus sp. JS10 TaxID=2950552 RepID=UPI00210E56A0|nr:prepilin-type N-terminal cleavage/methylation domain-containing protein [Saccharibacillus sp. JS10]MCQ4088778.1 prepilin-type N-terminal cleavage/methylation domain-containing protein [Saccharibacillus sp. JS10]
MKRFRKLRKEEGFTLIEVLAAMLILSIVALAFTAYFGNALTFAKSNQNQTIMSNLARNALVYMQKQNFTELQAYFNSGSATIVKAGNGATLPRVGITPETFASCGSTSEVGMCKYRDIFINKDLQPMMAVLQPTVNGIQYRVVIEYQKDLNRSIDTGGNLLLPISATVTSVTPGAAGPGANGVTVEGYVNAQSIR